MHYAVKNIFKGLLYENKNYLFNKMDFHLQQTSLVLTLQILLSLKAKNSTLLAEVILIGLKNLSFNMNFVEYNIKT